MRNNHIQKQSRYKLMEEKEGKRPSQMKNIQSSRSISPKKARQTQKPIGDFFQRMRDNFKKRNGFDLEELRRQVSASPVRSKNSQNRSRNLAIGRRTPPKFLKFDNSKQSQSKNTLSQKRSYRNLPILTSNLTENVPLKKQKIKKSRRKFSISKKKMKRIKKSELLRQNLSDKKVHSSREIDSSKSTSRRQNTKNMNMESRLIQNKSDIEQSLKFDSQLVSYSHQGSLDDNLTENKSQDHRIHLNKMTNSKISLQKIKKEKEEDEVEEIASISKTEIPKKIKITFNSESHSNSDEDSNIKISIQKSGSCSQQNLSLSNPKNVQATKKRIKVNFRDENSINHKSQNIDYDKTGNHMGSNFNKEKSYQRKNDFHTKPFLDSMKSNEFSSLREMITCYNTKRENSRARVIRE